MSAGGQPEDMAAALSFLVGPDAAYVHGHDLVVDGGLLNTLMPSLTMPAWQQPGAAAA